MKPIIMLKALSKLSIRMARTLLVPERGGLLYSPAANFAATSDDVNPVIEGRSFSLRYTLDHLLDHTHANECGIRPGDRSSIRGEGLRLFWLEFRNRGRHASTPPGAVDWIDCPRTSSFGRSLRHGAALDPDLPFRAWFHRYPNGGQPSSSVCWTIWNLAGSPSVSVRPPQRTRPPRVSEFLGAGVAIF
jgi:hypothetical protein